MILLEKDIKNITESISDIIPKFENKKIFIAGGLGFLGKYFATTVSYLNSNHNTNITLYLVDNLITSKSSNTSEFCSQIRDDNIHIKELDITNFNDFLDVDIVINAAGIASPYYYRKFPLETINASYMGNKNLLDLALRNNSKFIFFSSSEIYGNPDVNNIPTKETYNGNVTSIGSRSCYDESKRIGETLCYVYNEKYNLNTNIVRPFNVYGPGMSKFDYRVIPNFINNVIENQKLKIYSDGSQTRTYCYVSDAINGFLRVFVTDNVGETYNIGNSGPEISLIDLKNELEKAINSKVDYELISYPDSYPPDEPLRRCPDISKANEQLNYFPKIGMVEGLSNTFEWAKSHFPNEKS